MSEKFVCTYCKSKFTRESTLHTHSCEKKRRALAKDEKHVVLAFAAYKQFISINYPQQKSVNYYDFCNFQYYTAFVKFGSFVSNVTPLYPFKFIEFVVKSGITIDKWCNDDLYEKYVLYLIKTEHVETALERAVNHMLEWSSAHKLEWNEYFKQVSLSRAVYDIKDGKISPWVLLNSPHGKQLLHQFTDQQLAYIANIIDPTFWTTKFKHQKADLDMVKQVIKEGNM